MQWCMEEVYVDRKWMCVYFPELHLMVFILGIIHLMLFLWNSKCLWQLWSSRIYSQLMWCTCLFILPSSDNIKICIMAYIQSNKYSILRINPVFLLQRFGTCNGVNSITKKKKKIIKYSYKCSFLWKKIKYVHNVSVY